MSSTKVVKKIESITNIDSEGNETSIVKETSTSFSRAGEPDYVKLYTKMWCEFNSIPLAYRELFMQLAMRMSYCSHTKHGVSGQIVNTGGSWKRDIMDTLGWKSDAMYQRGLQALCKCHAIRKIGRGEYQVNPQYAGRGEWKYNPKLERGGVEDLVATFNFKDKTVDVNIDWADNGMMTDMNEMYRRALIVDPKEETVLKEVKKKEIENKDEPETSEKCDDTV